MASVQNFRDQIEGAWELISFDVCKENDPTPLAQPLGPKPLGRIMFLPSGYMSCTLTDPERAKAINSKHWSVASDEEVIFAARAMTTYCGYFTIYAENDEARLSTKVDIALDPNWIGSTQVRRVGYHEEGGEKFLTLKPVQYLELPVSEYLRCKFG